MNKKEHELIISFTDLEKQIAVASNHMKSLPTTNKAFCEQLDNLTADFKQKFYDILLESEEPENE